MNMSIREYIRYIYNLCHRFIENKIYLRIHTIFYFLLIFLFFFLFFLSRKFISNNTILNINVKHLNYVTRNKTAISLMMMRFGRIFLF